MSEHGYNQEHGEPFDPAAKIAVEAATWREAERVYWAGRVEELENQLVALRSELDEAKRQSALAGLPRAKHLG